MNRALILLSCLALLLGPAAWSQEEISPPFRDLPLDEFLGTMVDELERSGKETALVTLCVGAGMGTATIIERV